MEEIKMCDKCCHVLSWNKRGRGYCYARNKVVHKNDQACKTGYAEYLPE